MNKKKLCVCGHLKTDHFGRCGYDDKCECLKYKEKELGGKKK